MEMPSTPTRADQTISPAVTMPRVSVCVPVYNGAKYLDICLSGIAAQSFGDFEVLIVDDCSTDDSRAIADAWAARDPRFRVHVNEANRGLVGNWNHCIGLARGEWIKLFFQDDVIEPLCLEKMLLAGEGRTGFVACARTVLFEGIVDAESRQWYEQHQRQLTAIYGNRDELSGEQYSLAKMAALDLNIVGEPSVTLIRRDLFQRYGRFDPLMVQLCDSEMWNRLATNVGINYVPEKLVSFRVHRSSASQSNQGRPFRAHVLDLIVEWTRLCRAPQLDNFRRIIQSHGRTAQLERRLARQVHMAFDEARRARREAPHDDALNRELSEVLSQLPGYRLMHLRHALHRIRRLVFKT